MDIPFPESKYPEADAAGLHGCGSFSGSPFGSECSDSSRWNWIESLYIRLFGIVDLPTRMRARLVVRELQKIPWKTLIDFGSGRGAYSFYFSRARGVRVWGIDTDNDFVCDCRAINGKLRRPSSEFLRGCSIFEGNRFKPDSVDAVLAVESIQYVPDIQEGFREVQRVLKKGGHLIGHVPVKYRRASGKALFDTEGLLNFLKEAGLEPVSITRVFGPASRFLNLLFSWSTRSRLVAAIAFPALLLASLACGGKSPGGDYCILVARKP